MVNFSSNFLINNNNFIGLIMVKIINMLVYMALATMFDAMVRIDNPEQYRLQRAVYLFPVITTVRFKLHRLLCFIRTVVYPASAGCRILCRSRIRVALLVQPPDNNRQK